MAINPLGINTGTQAYINFDQSGTVNTQVVNIGTISGNVPGGSIAITSLPNTPGGTLGLVTRVGNVGTLEVGTITTLPNIPGGTVGLVTRVGNVGTVEVGTIATLPNIPGGTLGLVSSVANLAAGTVTRLEGGTLGLITRVGNVGTLEVGTISTLPNIPGGTIGLITRVGNVGTLEVGTISALPNLPQGSINVTAGTITAGSIRVVAGTVGGAAGTAAALSGNPIPVGGVTAGGTVYGLLVDSSGVLQVNGTVSTGGAGTQATRIIDGTVTNVGTVVGIGSISAVAQVHNAGTIAALPNVPGGTIGVVSSVTDLANLAKGTITRLEGGTLGVVSSITDVANLAKGTITRVEGGTIGLISSITNLAAGTVTRLEQGSINVTAGTFRDDGRTARNILSYGTQFGGTAAGYATLVGSASVGAGTATWVCDVSINNPNGNIVCLVGFGTALQGTSVLLRGTYGTTAGVGQQRAFPKPVNSGMTNQDLVAYIGGAGTVDFNVSYFIAP